MGILPVLQVPVECVRPAKCPMCSFRAENIFHHGANFRECNVTKGRHRIVQMFCSLHSCKNYAFQNVISADQIVFINTDSGNQCSASGAYNSMFGAAMEHSTWNAKRQSDHTRVVSVLIVMTDKNTTDDNVMTLADISLR